MKLVLLSNRVRVQPPHPIGGQATALASICQQQSGIWIGWSGEVRAQPRIHKGRHYRMAYEAFSLTSKAYQDYYQHYASQVLWPWMHGFTQYMRSHVSAYATYQWVNRLFAARALPHAQQADAVWVHDYHLLPVAEHLRDLGYRASIGYFHHVPIPAAATLHALAQHSQLMHSLLAYDQVGVQTAQDLAHLVAYFTGNPAHGQRGVVVQHDAEHASIYHRQGITECAVYPLGIDVSTVQQMAQPPEMSPLRPADWMPDLRPHQPLLLGVDRLDYTKGLETKLQGLGLYLQQHPQAASQRPVLLQLLPQSRGHLPVLQDLLHRLRSQVIQLDALYSRPDYRPVYLHQDCLPQASLLALYRRAPICLITSAKDGMNLVAQEYIAAQDPQDPGVLLLSTATGAAQHLPEAILMEPHDPQQVANAIAQALRMPLLERIRRHRALLQRLQSHTVQHWQQRFLNDLQAHQMSQPRSQTGT